MNWDGVLRVLRDPLFALAFSIFLALLASRAVGRFVRWMLILASIGGMWLLCRHRRWREVATVLFKCYFSAALVAECIESA